MKSLLFVKISEGQSHIHITIKYVFTFLQVIIQSQKIDVRLNKTLKLKFILMFLIVSIQHVLLTL